MNDEVSGHWHEDKATQLRQRLLRFAYLQLRDEQWAEDVVQDTLVSAYTKQDQFQAAAQWQTWVFAILKNKILDLLRQQRKQLQWQVSSEDELFLDAAHEQLFDETGHWRASAAPQAWQQPEGALQQQDFLRILEQCLQHLPDNTARVFVLREVMGLEVAEICTQTGISADNCYTLLYRARNGLRRCLQSHWFDQDKETAPC